MKTESILGIPRAKINAWVKKNISGYSFGSDEQETAYMQFVENILILASKGSSSQKISNAYIGGMANIINDFGVPDTETLDALYDVFEPIEDKFVQHYSDYIYDAIDIVNKTRGFKKENMSNKLIERMVELSGTIDKKKQLDESFVELDAYVPTSSAGKFMSDLRETLVKLEEEEDDCHVCDEEDEEQKNEGRWFNKSKISPDPQLHWKYPDSEWGMQEPVIFQTLDNALKELVRSIMIREISNFSDIPDMQISPDFQDVMVTYDGNAYRLVDGMGTIYIGVNDPLSSTGDEWRTAIHGSFDNYFAKMKDIGHWNQNILGYDRFAKLWTDRDILSIQLQRGYFKDSVQRQLDKITQEMIQIVDNT